MRLPGPAGYCPLARLPPPSVLGRELAETRMPTWGRGRVGSGTGHSHIREWGSQDRTTTTTTRGCGEAGTRGEAQGGTEKTPLPEWETLITSGGPSSRATDGALPASLHPGELILALPPPHWTFLLPGNSASPRPCSAKPPLKRCSLWEEDLPGGRMRDEGGLKGERTGRRKALLPDYGVLTCITVLDMEESRVHTHLRYPQMRTRCSRLLLNFEPTDWGSVLPSFCQMLSQNLQHFLTHTGKP